MLTNMRKLCRKLDEDLTWNEYWEAKSVQDELAFAEQFLVVKTHAYKRYAPRTGRILEAGCGLGRFVIFLRKQGYDALGIDHSFPPLSRAKQFDESLPLIQADVRSLPFPDDSLDAYISNGVIEHFEEGPKQILSEVRRVLVDQGILFLSIPIATLIGMPSYLKTYIGHKLIGRLHSLLSPGWHPPQRRFYQYDYTKRETLGFLKECGFEILETRPEDLYATNAHRIGIHKAIRVARKTGKETLWELNALGRSVAYILESIDPWLCCSHINCVARNRKRL